MKTDRWYCIRTTNYTFKMASCAAFMCKGYFFPTWARATVKGLVYVCQRQRERQPQQDKRGSANTLSTLCRYCLWTFQLKEILVSTFCPGWNVACEALFKCLGLNAMSATPHETVLIHFFSLVLLLLEKTLGVEQSPSLRPLFPFHTPHKSVTDN